MVIFLVFFGVWGYFFPIGVVDTSALGWGLVSSSSFRLSFSFFDRGVFWFLLG